MAEEKTPRGQVIRQAKHRILMLLEDWHINGRLNPASSIFLLKNLGGYSDTVTLETATNQPTASRSPEEIARMIESDVPMDEDVPVLPDGLTE